MGQADIGKVTATPNTVSATAYRPEIDGLRAIAILAVVLFHSGVPFTKGGFAGVDIFFVISGYLIGSHVYRDLQSGRFSFKSFYAKRAKRILPALFVVLFFCLLAGSALLSAAELRTLAESALATLFSCSNLYFRYKLDYFNPTASIHPLLMTWSLGVEEQFYIFLPMVMILLFRFVRRHMFAAVGLLVGVSLVVSIVLTRTNPQSAFFILPTRAWELGAGIMLALRLSSRKISVPLQTGLSIAGAILLTAAIACMGETVPFPGIAAAVPVTGAVLLIYTPESFISRRVLASMPFRTIGMISYSWYLWHWPLLSFAHLISTGSLATSTALALDCLSLAAAFLSWKFVEVPARSVRWMPSETLLRYAAVAAAMCLPFLLALRSGGWPSRFLNISGIEQHAAIQRRHPCLAPYGEHEPRSAGDCSQAGQPSVALWGDSHAEALLPAVAELARSEHIGLHVFVKTVCPPLSRVTHIQTKRPLLGGECASFNTQVLDRIKNDGGVEAVILAADWSAGIIEAQAHEGGLSPSDENAGAGNLDPNTAELLHTGIETTVDQLMASGKRVILIEDVPDFHFQPVERLRGELIPLRRSLGQFLAPSIATAIFQESRTSAVSKADTAASKVLLEVARNRASVLLVDPKSTLCDHSDCYAVDAKGELLYADDAHLSADGARRVLREVLLVRP